MKRHAIGARIFGSGSGGALSLDLPFSREARWPARVARPVVDRSEVGAKFFVVALFSFMAMRLGADFLQTGRLTGLLLLVSEALVVVLTVVRRSTGIVDRSARARTVTVLSLLGPPLVAPAAVAALLPGSVTVTLSFCAVLIVIAGKLTLGRSFGLMPANRGVVSTGLYGVVRHPIYMGYLISHVAFLAANPTFWNATTLVAADTALLFRAVCEEQTLARDEAYRTYLQKVRWRVLPWVF